MQTFGKLCFAIFWQHFFFNSLQFLKTIFWNGKQTLIHKSFVLKLMRKTNGLLNKIPKNKHIQGPYVVEILNIRSYFNTLNQPNLCLFEPVLHQAAQHSIDQFQLYSQTEVHLLEGPVKDTLLSKISMKTKKKPNSTQ